MALIAPNELQGALSALAQRQAATNTPANPGVLTSATGSFKMAGCAVPFTPAVSALVQVDVLGTVASDTGGDGTICQIAYGTGAAPAKNAAAAGTQIGAVQTNTAPGTTAQALVLKGFFTATVGTTYWIDVASKAVTGGNVNLTNLTILIKEY